MLKLTKKADYGLIAMKHLARVAPHTASAKEIAAKYHLPVPVLSKILQSLNRGGFLVSEQGTRGGYRLSRDPQAISTYEVVRAIDGPIFLTSCFTETGDCEHSGNCSIRDPLRKIHEGMISLLTNLTMADLAAESDGPAGPPPAAPESSGSLRILN